MYALSSTISLLEVLYTLTGLLGLIYAIRWTLKAESDRRGLLAEGLNGGRALAASINCAIGRAMSAKLGIYVMVGCLAMTLPNAAGAETPPWQSTVSGLAFLCSQGIAVWLLVFLNNRYDAMARYFDRHAAMNHGDSV